MHGVYAPERGRLSVVQTPRREDKQKWHGFTKNGLESIFDSHRRMDIFLPLCLVGVYQGALRASLTGSFLLDSLTSPAVSSRSLHHSPQPCFSAIPCSPAVIIA